MTLPPVPPRIPTTALVLTGGGARAAYQAGVLRAIAAIRRRSGTADRSNPFPIVTGTSAGAINAAALAGGADDFDTAVRRIIRVWRHIHAEHVYHTDALSALRSGTRWMSMLSLGWVVTRWRRSRPRSLLDNAPLAELLRTQIPLDQVPAQLAAGHLRGLAVTASSYTTGEHVTFYDSDETMTPWTRAQRCAVPVRIGVEHLLASAAIPFIFPATSLRVKGHAAWLGDGSMRQMAPISPAIHLGAERVLVIGAGRAVEPPGQGDAPAAYPSLAQVAGHALSSIFLDTLSADIERTRRINQTLSLLTPEARAQSQLHPVELLVISPSQRLDDLVARHVQELPVAVRALLAILGVRPDDPRSGALASYLLFEPGYTGALIRLGWHDTMRQRAEVCRFFGWPEPR